ncbi:hypothetical protein TNCV_2798621 [Trichonephila clavipes]|nr:hypothetical protein TNCV_2798621 [Trichonephila clavipes]
MKKSQRTKVADRGRHAVWFTEGVTLVTFEASNLFSHSVVSVPTVCHAIDNLNCQVNIYSYRIYSTENPRAIHQVPFASANVMVWCDFTSTSIIGTYFLTCVVPARISSHHCRRSTLPHASALIQRDFGCVLGVQQTKQLPHVAKVDLVGQLGV